MNATENVVQILIKPLQRKVKTSIFISHLISKKTKSLKEMIYLLHWEYKKEKIHYSKISKDNLAETESGIMLHYIKKRKEYLKEIKTVQAIKETKELTDGIKAIFREKIKLEKNLLHIMKMEYLTVPTQLKEVSKKEYATKKRKVKLTIKKYKRQLKNALL